MLTEVYAFYADPPCWKDQKLERFVLRCFHQLALARAFVVDAAKVQDAVDNNPIKFFPIRYLALLSIGSDGIQTNEKVAVQDVSLRIVKGYDVRIIVVVQILLVDL